MTDLERAVIALRRIIELGGKEAPDIERIYKECAANSIPEDAPVIAAAQEAWWGAAQIARKGLPQS